jgi:hypothetical protein
MVSLPTDRAELSPQCHGSKSSGFGCEIESGGMRLEGGALCTDKLENISKVDWSFSVHSRCSVVGPIIGSVKGIRAVWGCPQGMAFPGAFIEGIFRQFPA